MIQLEQTPIYMRKFHEQPSYWLNVGCLTGRLIWLVVLNAFWERTNLIGWNSSWNYHHRRWCCFEKINIIQLFPDRHPWLSVIWETTWFHRARHLEVFTVTPILLATACKIDRKKRLLECVQCGSYPMFNTQVISWADIVSECSSA